jgi:hypothetical protein
VYHRWLIFMCLLVLGTTVTIAGTRESGLLPTVVSAQAPIYPRMLDPQTVYGSGFYWAARKGAMAIRGLIPST